MTKEEVAIVGDVHGDALLLEKLLSKVEDFRRIVFVGDLVNRGPDTKNVLNIIVELTSQRHVHIVRGNHELYLSEFLSGGSFLDFALRGGIPTIISYVPEVVGDVREALIEALPDSHKMLLSNAVEEFRQEGLLVKHWDRRAENALEDSSSQVSNTVLVVGHRAQRKAHVKNGVAFLDTGAGNPEGSLSAFLWPSRTFLTVSH